MLLIFTRSHPNKSLVGGPHSFSQPSNHGRTPGDDLRMVSHPYLNSRPGSPRRHAHSDGPTRHCTWRISAWLALLCTSARWGYSWWCKRRLAPRWSEAASQELRGWTPGGLRHCHFLQNRRGHEDTAWSDGTCIGAQSITHPGSKDLSWAMPHPVHTTHL